MIVGDEHVNRAIAVVAERPDLHVEGAQPGFEARNREAFACVPLQGPLCRGVERSSILTGCCVVDVAHWTIVLLPEPGKVGCSPTIWSLGENAFVSSRG